MLLNVCKTKPFNHQAKALELGHKQRVFAYFMEMGTGKTKVAIDNANYLFENGEINDVIVIAPNSVYRNWESEIYNHSKNKPDIFIWKKHNLKKLAKYKYNNFFFLLMNVEALSRSSGVKFLKDHLLKRGSESMVIIDESTTIKNKGAQRTKSLVALGLHAKYRRILTGSPVTKSPLDLYTQCEFLHKSLLGFKSYYSFRNRYAVMHEIYTNQHTVKIPVKYINLEELEHKLKQFSYRCTKNECLDLPPKLHTKRIIEMSPNQKKFYEKLSRDARAIILDKQVSYSNKLTEIIKLHQVVCGFSKADDGEIIELENKKMKELECILEETNEKSIIWATYVFNIKQIVQMLEKKYGKESVVSLYGEISVEDRSAYVDRFQNDNRCRFLVGNPSVGGYGLTLTAARNVIYFSNNYNLEYREQSEDRAHRISQKYKVTYIDIVIPNTIDELILTSLKAKKQLSETVLGDDVKKYL